MAKGGKGEITFRRRLAHTKVYREKGDSHTQRSTEKRERLGHPSVKVLDCNPN